MTGETATADARRPRPSDRCRHPGDPPDKGPVGRRDPGWQDPPGVTPRRDAGPIRKGSLAAPTQFGYTGQVNDNSDGIVVDYALEAGMPPDAPRLAPAIAKAITATGVGPDAVTADRGYGQTSVDEALAELGVELVKWHTGAEGRTSALKRQHGWGRARLRGLEGARTWCVRGVPSHNAIKIAALS